LHTLTREPCANDARGAYAALTSEGLQALRRCWRVYGRQIEKLIGRRMSSAEARHVAELLRRLLERPGDGRSRET
jgi:DNA-binding MarR family transcriptional regulator